MTMLEDVRAALVELLATEDRTYADTVIDAVLMGVDVNAASSSAQVRVQWEWWDGTSPINGVPADRVRAQVGDVDRAYVVYVDGKATYFQTHVPEAEGLEPLQAGTVFPEMFVLSLVNEMALTTLVRQARDLLVRLDFQQAEREATPVVAPLPMGSVASADTVVGRRRRTRSV